MNPDYLNRMRLPKRLWGTTIGVVQNPQRKYLEKFIANMDAFLKRGVGLLLWGDYGRGKSSAGAVLLQSIADRGRTGLFVYADDITGYVINKTAFDADMTMIERMMTVDLLVIDDFTIAKKDSFADSKFEMIFRRRTSEMKSTIITTNLSPTFIKENFPALFAVMIEVLFPVRFDGMNLRESSRDGISGEFENG